MARKQIICQPEIKRTFVLRNKKAGAGMTRAGVAAYRRANPGSKIKNSSDRQKLNLVVKLQRDVNHSAQEVQDK